MQMSHLTPRVQEVPHRTSLVVTLSCSGPGLQWMIRHGLPKCDCKQRSETPNPGDGSNKQFEAPQRDEIRRRDLKDHNAHWGPPPPREHPCKATFPSLFSPLLQKNVFAQQGSHSSPANQLSIPLHHVREIVQDIQTVACNI